MYSPIEIEGTTYSRGEFGRWVYSNRRRLNMTQIDLAKRIYDLMYPNGENAPKEFSAESGRVMISRIESGKINTSPEYAEALMYIFNINDNSIKDTVLTKQRVDEVIEELRIIINSIPPQSTENLLSIARMIKTGGLNNIS